MPNKLLTNPMLQIIDSTGPLDNAKIYTYLTGTTTLHDTKVSASGATHANPIVTNSSGYPDAGSGSCGIYLDPAVEYTITVKNKAGTTLWSLDNVTAEVLQSLTSIKTSAYSIVAADNNGLVPVNATSAPITITLPAVADVPAGFNAVVKKIDASANAVTVDGSGAETIDGSATVALANQYDVVRVISNGTSWYVENKTTAGGSVTTVYDTSANIALGTSATAAAVDYLVAKNAAAGGTPKLVTAGSDTNIPIQIAGLGTGKVVLGQATSTAVQLLADQPLTDSSSNELIKFVSTASAVNELTVTNSATTVGPILSATGETNVDLQFQAKGTGSYNFKGTTAKAAEIRVFEDLDNGSNYTGFKGAASIAANVTFTLPSADGAANSALITDGAGTLSFSSAVNKVLQIKTTQTSAFVSCSTNLLWDDSIPQITEGDQVLSLAITPTTSGNIIICMVNIQAASASSVTNWTTALFDGSTGAVCAQTQSQDQATADLPNGCTFNHYYTTSGTSPITFSVRVGDNSGGTITVNGAAGARKLGGVGFSRLILMEVTP